MLTRRFLATALAATILSGPVALRAARAQAADPSAFINQLGNQFIAIINGPGSYDQKKAQLRPVVEGAVDVDGVARFCLGRFWRTATPAQQAEYLRLFHDVLMNNIFGKIGEFRGVTFQMAQTTPRDGESVVGTIITRPNQKPNDVRWVVANVGGQNKIVDVIAEGTSLRLTQRADYAAYLQRNGNNLDALIAAMRQQVGR